MEIAAEWPYDKVLQLIALFQQRPMLWDTRCEDYKDRQKRREATVELAAHFHVERNEIERKLKNLQSHFYREVKKEEQWSVCRGSSAAYRSKWFAYRAMRFLVDKDKLKRNQIAAGGMTPVLAQRQKSTEMARGSAMRTHSDKSRRYLVGTRLRSSEYQTKLSSLRISPAKMAIEDKKAAACLANDVASTDFLYVDTNQQNNLDDSQIDYWDEKPNGVANQDPIEFAAEVNGEAQRQPQRLGGFEDTRMNEKSVPSTRKQDLKVIPEEMIAPAIDFLLTEAKTHDSNDPELNFYRGLIPDITKLSDRRRRQFKEVVLCTLNKLLDEDEKDRIDAEAYES